MAGQSLCRCPVINRQTSRRIWEAAMAFRQAGVHEIREVLRLWVRGEGLRSIERLSGRDRKTPRLTRR